MGQLSHITGIEVDYSRLKADRFSSASLEAVKYRRAYARANNAIEGVVLSEADKHFMDHIPAKMSKTDFTQAVLDYIRAKPPQKDDHQR